MRRARRSLILMVAAALVLPVAAHAEQASQPLSPAAGQIEAGRFHSCAIVAGTVRCWGYGGDGALGYGNTNSIGDNESPGLAGAVNLGPGRTATALGVGYWHTCALLDDDSVRCWGYNGNGELGIGNPALPTIGDDETPNTIAPVSLGGGAKAITSGRAHNCVIMKADSSVRCWGHGFAGQLGYGNQERIGDNELPSTVAPVSLGAGRTAKAISAGDFHTCAILDDDTVRCWGYSGAGALGYGFASNLPGEGVGDNEPASDFGPVMLGTAMVPRTAKAIGAGGAHTCVILDTDMVECWGTGGGGRLGYGNGNTTGSTMTTLPGQIGPLDLGPRTAKAITAGGDFTCAVLDDSTVRCWGVGTFGQIGYPNTITVGDSPPSPSVAAAGPVALGAGRTATAVTAGVQHTCAQLDDGSVRCWGRGSIGQLGYCSDVTIGDTESPATVGPVDFGTANAGCPAVPSPPTSAGSGGGGSGTQADTSTPATEAVPLAGDQPATPLGLAEEAARTQRLRSCLSAASRRPRRQRARARRACTRQHGRTPGRVTGVRLQSVSRTRAVMSFAAPGSDGANPPAARAYLIRQSRRSLRGRTIGRTKTLCNGSCRFSVTDVGAQLNLSITNLRPRSVYRYTIRARDNVSNRVGRPSPTARVTMR